MTDEQRAAMDKTSKLAPDEQRAALVEELSAAMAGLVENNDALIQLVYTPDEYTNKVLMPIIDRVIAELDIDAMLDAVPNVGLMETRLLDDGSARASVFTLLQPPWNTWKEHKGTGPTRTAAILDACRKAREGVR